MKLIKTVLQRPSSAIMIILSIIIFGISSITGMQLEYFPNLEMPMKLVYVLYPGADADSIVRLVTKPIEDLGDGLTGIKSVHSVTKDNYATVQFSYEYGADSDEAYKELKMALDNISKDLPPRCEQPMIMEISLNSAATMSISAVSADGSDIQDYLNDTVLPQLETLGGVAQVDMSGAQDKYCRIVLNESKMQQYKISISDVASAIAATDFDMPLGNVTVGSQKIGIAAYTDMDLHTDFADIPIKTGGGQPVRLSDVSDFMNLYTAEAENISRYNGMSSVLLNVTKKTSAPTIATCNNVLKSLDTLKTDSVTFKVVHSSADDIMSSLQEVLSTLVVGVLFTMAVLLVFFGDLRASLIVGSSMPLSILMAMIMLKMTGMSFDLMAGTGMIIAIGMIVDNSIVVLESCFRTKSSGLSFKEAAAKGTGAMLSSVFASTLTTVVVYAPLCLTTGLSGQMNQPLCWTIIFTLVASLLSAVTVVPLLFMLVKPKEKEKLPINKVLEKLRQGYAKIIPNMLRRPKRTVIVALIIFISSILLATHIRFDIFPNNFDGSIEVNATFRSGTKLEIINERIRDLEQDLLEDQNFSNVTLEISGNKAAFMAYSSKDCKRSSEDAVEYYTEHFRNVSGMDVAVIPAGASSGLASLMSTGNNMDITLKGEELSALESGAALVEASVSEIPGVMKIDNIFSQNRTKGRVVINPQKTLDAGMTPASVATQIYYFLNGMTATSIDYEDKTYDIKLEYPKGKYDDVTALMDRALVLNNGTCVTMGDIASLEYTNTLPSISRQDGMYIATVTATLTTESKYAATDAIKAKVATIGFPAGVTLGQSATEESLGEEMGNMGSAIMIAVFLVFLVMALQFDSPRLSMMVMMCIPFSLAGSFGLLFLAGSPLSMMAMMGFLMLIGMVVNNGILLVDATNTLRQEMPLKEALIQAGVTRLRPILMTTLTTVLSMMPMVLSNNSGMAMMKGMSYVIIGGLCTSTVLAMFLMPPFYLLINGENMDGTKKQRRPWLKKKSAKEANLETDVDKNSKNL